MKSTIITLITSLILLLPASGQGQWEIVELEIKIIPMGEGQLPIDGLADVQFIDRDIGFIVAGVCGYHVTDGALHKTEDGGKTWNLIRLDLSRSTISSILFVNESKGYMMNRGDHCDCCGWYTSSDGGHSWTEDTVISNLSDISDIFFLNDSTGWAVVLDKMFMYKTIDGGESWSAEIIGLGGKFNSMYFIDEESGWAVGETGMIAKYTLNNGWERFNGLTSLPLNKVFFVDRDNGWIAGGYSSSGDIIPILLRTVDGGENWDKITKPNYLINDFYFENKDHGWAVGGYGEVIGSTREIRGVILETFNGGSDWNVVMDSLPARLNALHIADGIGWAVGDSGLILTNDATITWIKEDNKKKSSNKPLFQNYPNPFQSSTIISYQLPAISDVEISVYEISGRKVSTLVQETQQSGSHEVEWNAGEMQPGIYICELRTGQTRQVMKMIVIK